MKSGTRILKFTFALRTYAVISASAFALLAWQIPAKANINLVQNGSFETTTLTKSTQFTSEVTDWTTSGYNFLVLSGTGQGPIFINQYQSNLSFWPGITHQIGNSPAGGNFVAADGAFEVGAITQTITGLSAGQSYNVSFYQAAAQQNGFSGATTERWDVSLGGGPGQLSQIFTNPNHDFQAWEQQTMTFSATSGTEVLSFLAVGTPVGEPPFSLLDGVSLTAATPEPAYLALTAAGLLGLFAVRRLHRKRA